jgi:RNA polymerase sigma-70 factor, ECF subfamily
LSSAEQQLLRRYVDLFNARDFDTLRSMLAADVKLDLVNRLQLEGAAVGQYFARYAQTHGWHARPAVVEGRPGLLIQQVDQAQDARDYFVVLGWDGGRVATIRDFLFARYASDGADYSPM